MDVKIERLPAMIYSVLWEAREMGYLWRLLKRCRVKKMRILLYFEDYEPGALIDFNDGDFIISPVDSTKLGSVIFDGRIFGKLKVIINAMEGNIIWQLIKSYWKKDISMKGRWSLIRFGLLMIKCIL